MRMIYIVLASDAKQLSVVGPQLLVQHLAKASCLSCRME